KFQKIIIYIMEITKKVSGTGEIKIQEEIEKILSRYKLSFDRPHCHKEINETHFDEKSKALKIINEKLRNIAEQEYIFRQNSYKQQWLKELIENKKYEDRKSTRLNSSHVAISYAVFC